MRVLYIKLLIPSDSEPSTDPLIINMKLGEKKYIHAGWYNNKLFFGRHKTNFHIKPFMAFIAICVKGKTHIIFTY